ncbi:MAG: hypothetical protein E7198_11485 [Schwartzia succinivorans]|uniref:hypothetical protein n=1 Tax=Schwartzia succinivorans TaxID=55507 RepID=UPI002356CF24|nr:hypothetical protein [Schwartzia succinivorans]MBE6098386.1 hypothetical protein [Schwartzia succinivorans]
MDIIRKNFGEMDNFYEINIGETDFFVYDNYGEVDVWIDFSAVSKEIKDCFDDIVDLEGESYGEIG